MTLYNQLRQDVRFREGLKACMNCGVCTAICPAAEFFDYDPRMLLVKVQTRDDKFIEELLRSETIWHCGQCMSCKTRCPRGNTPGLVINALRKLSQELGYFTESHHGRQQYALKKVISENILQHGYCIHPDAVKPELHPEQGPAWEWFFENRKEMYARLGANLDQDGPGTLRKIPKGTLEELKTIMEESGAVDFWEKIETFSQQKASEMGFSNDEGGMLQYFCEVFTRL